jgi:protein KRI1
LGEGERYIRDFILNKRYLEKSEDETDESNDEAVKNDDSKPGQKQPSGMKSFEAIAAEEDFSEEEKQIENQELFERKYNFRYEEPDPEFIKAYPRTIADSMRRKDSKRKEKREEYKTRKELEKKKKKDELKHLKNLKRREIMQKLEKIKKITGNHDLRLDVDDLDADFDPDEHERKMEVCFNLTLN